MSIIVLDFESAYDSEYTLKKMTTEEYIRDPRFEVIGVSISIGGAPATWHPGASAGVALSAIDWSQHSMLAHNNVFDGAILGWHYNLYPALYLDTLSMARACQYGHLGVSLEKQAECWGLGVKGGEVALAKGKRLADFTPAELHAYGMYCINDNHLCRDLYKAMSPGFPVEAIRVIDQTLRMFIQPMLVFDRPTLEAHYEDVLYAKWQGLAATARVLELQWEGAALPVDDPEGMSQLDAHNGGAIRELISKRLNSAGSLSQILESLGVSTPTKLSPTTGLVVPAFAKTDPEFVALLEHDDPAVQAVVAARLGNKSTIEETRAERYLSIQTRGAWPVLLNWFGGDTSRFSGGDKANPQNLTRKGRLRYAVCAPPGHVLIVPDLSQIECRMVNYLAGQEDVVQSFRDFDAGTGSDVYCILASKIYQRLITPADSTERTVGKIGELSLGFGGGKDAYKAMLFSQAGLTIELATAQDVVDIYRGSHPKVKLLWKQGNAVLRSLIRGESFTFGRTGLLDCSEPDIGIGLPDGLWLRYPDLTQKSDADGDVSFTYLKRRKRVFIHGAKLVQNVTEGLCRHIMTAAWLRIATRYRICMSTHDELVSVVPERDAAEAKEFIRGEMLRPLPWAEDFPLACSIGVGRTYGEAH